MKLLVTIALPKAGIVTSRVSKELKLIPMPKRCGLVWNETLTGCGVPLLLVRRTLIVLGVPVTSG